MFAVLLILTLVLSVSNGLAADSNSPVLNNKLVDLLNQLQKSTRSEAQSKLVQILQQRSAVTCYSCQNGAGSSCGLGSCSGQTCYHSVATDGSNTVAVEGCRDVYVKDTCIDTNVQGVSGRVCYCNTNYCNDKGTYPTVAPSPNSIRCYDCQDESHTSCTTGTCYGASCIKSSASKGKDKAVVEMCSSVYVKNSCVDKTIQGYEAHVCYCNSDQCNDVGRVSAAVFSVLGFLLLGLVISAKLI